MKDICHPAKKLGDTEVATLVMGQSPDSVTYNSKKEGLPFYQGKTDFGLIYPTPRVWCSAPLRLAKAGDTLISVRAPVGDVNLAGGDCCLGRGIAAARSTVQTNPLFLFFALASVKSQFVALSTGTTFQSVNKTAVESIEIPFPSIPHQEKIAAVLWKVQRAIEAEDKLVATTRELKQSAMRQLFTHGLRGEKQKETETGTVPATWQKKRIRELGQAVTGTTPPTAKREYYDGGEIAFIAPGDLGTRTFINTTAKKITEAGLGVSRQLPKHTICFVCIGSTIGKVGITVDDRSATNQQINAVIVNADNDPIFVGYLLAYHSEYIASFSSPSPVPIMSKGIFENISVYASSDKNEQKEIAGILQTLDRKISIHERKRDALSDLFQTLLHQLMTAAIRVDKLDIDTREVAA